MVESTFEALVNDRPIPLSIGDDSVTIENRAQSYSLEKTGPHSYSLLLENRSAAVVIEQMDVKQYRVTVDGYTRIVRLKDERDLLLEEMGLEEIAGPSNAEIRAPMPGLVLAVHVEEDQMVEAGDALVVVEAMKMENELQAPAGGRVTAVHVRTGETVRKDQLLVEVEPDE